GVVDARRCLSWRLQDVGVFPREVREALGDRIYGCDECLEVCPPGRRAAGADEDARPGGGGDGDVEGDGARTAGGRVDLLALLAATDEELLDRHGRWYVPRRDPQYLRRNALVVL